ncbi:hypothetical protein Tco_0949277 [Tanacetum coccineum]
MESLHVSFQRVIDRVMFSPIIIGTNETVSISHLFYADDAMFIGKWSSSNANVHVMMLYCFFLVSGLKININKSSIYGLGVNSSEISLMANRIGCMANKLPFTYLGVKVGANMTHISSWNIVVQKVKSKLSSWKAKTLSVGGRLTLIKSVLGALPTYYMSLFRVPDGVLNQLEGLRNSFFLGADIGLWLDVIKAIHGPNGALDQPLPNHLGCSVWNMNEKWLGEECFKVRFNRLFNLELNKDVSVGQKLQNSNWAFTFRRRPRGGSEECQWIEFSQLLSSVVLSSASDRWSWSLNGDGVFSVKSARKIIDNYVLANFTSTTRWSKLLPIKFNVFA